MNQTPTFQDVVRRGTFGLLNSIAQFLGKKGITPNFLTLMCLGLTAYAAIYIADGRFQKAALILIIGLPLDALDGAVARAMNQVTKFGGILDSTLDRYADGLIFGTLAYYFFFQRTIALFFALTGCALGRYDNQLYPCPCG